MAPWPLPALKAIIPHVGTIIGAAGPVFTKKTADQEAEPLVLVARQISELQAAAAKNTADTKELAAQLQGIVTTLEKASEETQTALRRATLLSGAAIAVSVVAVGVAIAAFIR